MELKTEMIAPIPRKRNQVAALVPTKKELAEELIATFVTIKMKNDDHALNIFKATLPTIVEHRNGRPMDAKAVSAFDAENLAFAANIVVGAPGFDATHDPTKVLSDDDALELCTTTQLSLFLGAGHFDHGPAQRRKSVDQTFEGEGKVLAHQVYDFMEQLPKSDTRIAAAQSLNDCEAQAVELRRTQLSEFDTLAATEDLFMFANSRLNSFHALQVPRLH